MGASFPPAWYDDPTRPGGKRWWDGTNWTHHTQPPAAPVPAPLVAPPTASPLAAPQSMAAHQVAQTTTMETGLFDTGGRQQPHLQQSGLHPEAGYVFADAHHPDRPAHRPWWKMKRVLVPAGFAFLLLGAIASTAGQPENESTTAADVVDGSLSGVNQLVDDRTADTSTASNDPSTVPSTVVPASTSTVRSTTSTTTDDTTVETAESPTEASAMAAPAEAASETTAPPTTRPSTSSSTAAPTTAAPTTAAPTTQAPTTAPPTTPAPTTAAPTTAAPTTSGCHPAYSPCLAHHPGDALNCGDLSSAQKPVTVYNPNNDPYGLDADNDGVGCESG